MLFLSVFLVCESDFGCEIDLHSNVCMCMCACMYDCHYKPNRTSISPSFLHPPIYPVSLCQLVVEYFLNTIIPLTVVFFFFFLLFC